MSLEEFVRRVAEREGSRSARPASTRTVRLDPLGVPRPAAAKQRAKRFYGLREKQFRRVFDRARRSSGPIGDELLTLLGRRSTTS